MGKLLEVCFSLRVIGKEVAVRGSLHQVQIGCTLSLSLHEVLIFIPSCRVFASSTIPP
jgi:hypothetical protein